MLIYRGKAQEEEEEGGEERYTMKKQTCRRKDCFRIMHHWENTVKDHQDMASLVNPPPLISLNRLWCRRIGSCVANWRALKPSVETPKSFKSSARMKNWPWDSAFSCFLKACTNRTCQGGATSETSVRQFLQHILNSSSARDRPHP